MRKKRTKQIQAYIDFVNEICRNYYVKWLDSDHYEVFHTLQTFLIHNDMYRGFNFFKYKTLEDGERIVVLAGSGNPDEYDFIQLY